MHIAWRACVPHATPSSFDCGVACGAGPNRPIQRTGSQPPGGRNPQAVRNASNRRSLTRHGECAYPLDARLALAPTRKHGGSPPLARTAGARAAHAQARQRLATPARLRPPGHASSTPALATRQSRAALPLRLNAPAARRPRAAARVGSTPHHQPPPPPAVGTAVLGRSAAVGTTSGVAKALPWFMTCPLLMSSTLSSAVPPL